MIIYTIITNNIITDVNITDGMIPDTAVTDDMFTNGTITGDIITDAMITDYMCQVDFCKYFSNVTMTSEFAFICIYTVYIFNFGKPSCNCVICVECTSSVEW